MNKDIGLFFCAIGAVLMTAAAGFVRGQSKFAAGCKVGEQVQRLRMQQQLVDARYAHYNEWTSVWELRSFDDIALEQMIMGGKKK